MKKYYNPSPDEYAGLCARVTYDQANLEFRVDDILSQVQSDGDTALKKLSQQFDEVALERFAVDLRKEHFDIDGKLASAIELAHSNISAFHELQRESPAKKATMSGVTCWRKSLPIERVGLYIPGGTAPLFSTLLMLAIPAKIAGCKEIVVCTPPGRDGKLNPVMGWTCQLLGLQTIYLIGGAQAIGAMAYGTETVPAVNKIFGPGNQYVTQAKQRVQRHGVSIDMPAGPSEVLVIADASATPSLVAADLLSQAEHGTDSQVILVTDSKELLDQVAEQLIEQVDVLPRKDIAEASLANSRAILVNDLIEAVDFSNEYAPEHLILATENANQLSEGVTNAGSVFLGKWSCESAGDYASGTNHTLPTNGYAKNYSGVSLDSFVKKITFQELTAEGLENLGPAVEVMAEAEQLYAHKNAISLRLKELENG